eukprot:10537321-Lingulodinium_polyedra.AAC.1
MFAGYMRPGEAMAIRARSVVPPAGSSPYVALNLFPTECAQRSKTGLNDLSILLDCQYAPWLGAATL